MAHGPLLRFGRKQLIMWVSLSGVVLVTTLISLNFVFQCQGRNSYLFGGIMG